MFCEKCGKVIDEDAVFCPECGASVNENVSEDVTQKKKKYGWIIGLSVAGGALVLFLIIGVIFFMNHNKYIDLVKNGCPELYPDSAYGEAFSAFFSEPEWKYFQSDDEEDVVEFNGKCTFSDETTKVKIQFLIDDDEDSATFHTLALDGEEQSDFLGAIVLAAIFEKYEDGDSDGELDALEEEENPDTSGEDFDSSEEEDYEDTGDDDYDEYGDAEDDNYEDYGDMGDDDYDETDWGASSSDDLGEDTEAYYDSQDTDDYSDTYEGYEDYEEDYIFWDSDTRILKDRELKYCDTETLRLARNEIYARHGRKFKDAELQAYFESMPWYEGTIEPEDFKETVLNQYEKKNLKKIARYENR